MTEIKIPADFDNETYLALHPDIRSAEVNPASHYLEFGRAEGRSYLWSHEPQSRSEFFSRIYQYKNILEIGPFDRPVSPTYMNNSAKVEYADWMSTEDLIARANKIQDRNPSNVPHISYVVSGSLSSSIRKKYDCVTSSHMMEHVPDLITHLQDIQGLLNPGGVYLFTVPDKRACFDLFIQESSLPEIITAYLEKRTRPSLRSVIEHRAFTVQENNFSTNPFSTNPMRHPPQDMWLRILSAKKEYEENTYVDVHCWYFTPESLLQIIKSLITIGLLSQNIRIQTFQLIGEIGCIFANI